MNFRLLFAALAIAGVTAGPRLAFARDLIVVTRSGETEAALREAEVKPFIDAGNAVDVESWSGDIDALRAKLADWDVVEVEAPVLATGCDQSLFEKLDWSALGGRDRFNAGAASDCGMGAAASAVVLAWDRDKFPNAPSWSDFWDIAKFPGKRGLRHGPEGNLEFALIADGVAPADVYRTLRSDDGVERAFRKLDQLKPYLVWWSSSEAVGAAAKLLGSGEVLMTSAPNTQIVAANRRDHRNFAIQWNGGMLVFESWAVAKGSPNLPMALKFLAFVGDAKVENRLPGLAGLGGLAKGANDGLPADVAATSPTLPANLQNGFVSDASFWKDNASKLGQRFETWLAH